MKFWFFFLLFITVLAAAPLLLALARNGSLKKGHGRALDQGIELNGDKTQAVSAMAKHRSSNNSHGANW